MNAPFFGVNAFSKNSFSGNPAGVCILEEWLSTDELQALSNQLHFPETAFVIPARNEVWSIRWFSCKKEIDLCGHATLAAAHAIFHSGRSKTGNRISFCSKSGPLDANLHEDNTISIVLPTLPFRTANLSTQLVEGLGAYPESVWIGTNYMCLFDNADKIQSLKPDFSTLLNLRDGIGVIVTSAFSGSEYDFVSRYFAPRIGINEDHATGSAHCMLVPFWAKRLRKTNLLAFQASSRGGVFHCQDLNGRVSLRGKTEEFLAGQLKF